MRSDTERAEDALVDSATALVQLLVKRGIADGLAREVAIARALSQYDTVAKRARATAKWYAQGG